MTGFAYSNDEKLPDEKAVWREGRPVVDVPCHVQVTVDYGSGAIERCLVGDANWRCVTRWRFGWAPATGAA